MDLLCGLAGILLLLVGVAVFGHLLWLLAAAVWRAGRDPATSRQCPACGERLQRGQVHCTSCGFSIALVNRGTLEEELAATRRQVNRLRIAGRITEPASHEILEGIQADVRSRDRGVEPPEMEPATSKDWESHPTSDAGEPLGAPTARRTSLDAPIPAELPSPAEAPIAAAEARVESLAPTAARLTSADDASRGLAGILQSFMEEKNIRWGELISGLLIVGSSVGLVISLWATLKEAIPYFPVAVFLIATAAMHAAGLYTLKRWRLKSTSRGLLLVSTLLVPLNVLAAMVLNETKPTYGTIDYAAFAIGLAVLAAIAISAARILNRRNPWPLVVAVVGTAVGMSTIGRLTRPGEDMWRTIGLFGLPFLSFLVGAIAHVAGLSAGRRLTARRAAESFRFYGIAAFGLVLAAGLLASKAGDVRGTLSLLSPMLTAMAATLTGAGLIVHKRIIAPLQAGFRTAGTSIALGGGFLTAAALVLAWPRVDLLIAVGLLDALAFTLLAWFTAFPPLHVCATASFSFAFLLWFQWARGEISIAGESTVSLAMALLKTQAALVIALLSLSADAIALVLARIKERRHAAAYWASAFVHEAASVAIAAWAVLNALPDRHLATAVAALLAVRWFVATWWIKRDYATWIAAALLLAALGHGLAMNDRVAQLLAAHGMRPADPWKISFLLHATICLAYAVFARWARSNPAPDGREKGVIVPLMQAAIASTIFYLPFSLVVANERYFAYSGYTFWASAIWFGIALLQGMEALAIAAQILATLGIVFAVTGHCRTEAWWTGRFSEPLFLNFQLGALAAWSGLWIALRRFGGRVPALARVVRCVPTSVDRVVLAGVVFGLTGTCLAATLPGVLGELAAVVATPAARRPFLALVLVPFAAGAVLFGARALFSRRWQEAATFALSLVIVGAALLSAPGRVSGSTWPGFPTPYGQGWGAGAWIALALALGAVLAAHREKPGARATLAGISLLLCVVPFLIACRWDSALQTASALRFASSFAALTVALLWTAHRPLARLVGRPGGGSSEFPARSAIYVRNALVATTSVTVLILTSQALVAIVGQGRIAPAPVADNLIVRIGPLASYGMPMAILAGAFLVYAIADRRVAWGLAATLLAQWTFGLVASLSLALARQPPTVAQFVRYLQEMGLSAAIAAVVWFGIEPFVRRRRSASEHDFISLLTPVRTQLGLVAAFASSLAVGAASGLWLSPASLFDSVRQCGAPLGWLLLLSATAVWCWHRRAGWPRSTLAIGLLFLVAAAPLAAGSLGRWNSADNWLSYHVATTGWCAMIGLAALAAAGANSAERRTAAMMIADRALIFLPVILIFAFKAEWFDPQRPWWAAGATIWLSVCVTAMAAGAGNSRRAVLSLVLACQGAAFIGLRPWLGAGHPLGWQPTVDLVHITIFGAAIHGMAWLAIELTHERRRERALGVRSKAPPAHHVAAVIGSFLVGCTTLAIASRVPGPYGFSAATPLAWSTIGLLALLTAGSLWERRAEHPFPLLYALGVIAIAAFLDWRQLDSERLLFAGAASSAGYVLLSGALWTVRRPLKQIGLRLGMSPFAIDGERVGPWLAPAGTAIAALVIGVEFWIVLTFADPLLRVGGAFSTLALACGLALLAAPRRREIFQIASLVVGAAAAVQFGWGLMAPFAGGPHEELRRTIRLMAMLAATTFVYGLPLVRFARRESSWSTSIRRTAIGVGGTAVVTLALVLALELRSFDPNQGSPVTAAESVLVAVTLVALAAGLVSLAVLPGRDPFLRTERQRFLYVYAAESVAGLLFAHLYLMNPQLFRHALQPYWPLVVMAIAFGGTAVSELFRRLRVNALAAPLEHTAAFLPVLPVVGFWLMRSDLTYSTTLVAVGLLYLLLSLRRGSFAYAAATAVVGNTTLCSLFFEHGVSLLLHPQMFVIPPCVTILAAAHMNRDRLDASVLSAVRYFAITTIYVSSTGEMFQNGIGTTLWLPMALAGLSVLGVLSGIVLRVRAFLYLGTSFLLLSIISMVWHAARSIGHVWPWWVFLFALGVGLLTLFGVFEKKRPEVLALVDRLRQWER